MGYINKIGRQKPVTRTSMKTMSNIKMFSLHMFLVSIQFVSFMLLFMTRCAIAQADFEKGFQTYQSYHGSDFDMVNLANGNLILNIPLLSYQQRGGLPPVVVSIRSNSTTFQSTPAYQSGPLDTKQHEVSSGVIGSPWGQPHVVISPGGLSWREERIATASHTASGSPEYLTRFVALDESGATHSLGGSVANLVAGLVPGISYSVDGSGLMLQPGPAPNGQLIVDRQGLIGGLTDLHGNTFLLNGQCVRPPGTGDLFDASLASWEGYAHGTASASSFQDSIGRLIPNPSYLPPAVPYSCIVDLDATYHPATPDANGCETWNFPALGSGNTVPLTFCYKQIAINATIPLPISVGSPVPGGNGNTYPCNPHILGSANTLSCETINETWWVLYSVTLPNLTKWTFGYDSYGQVNSVTMPTGATVTYGYATRLSCGNPPGEIPVSGTPVWPYSNLMSSRMVTSRILNVYDNTPPKQWTYSSNIGSGWASSPNSGTVTVTDPDLNDTVHTFALQGQSVCGPYETETKSYQGPAANGLLLKKTDTVYSNTGLDYANPTNFSNYLTVGVFPKTTTTTLPTSGSPQVSQDGYTYDAFGTYQDYVGDTHPFSFGQVLSATESDWGVGAPGPVLRTTLHTHLWQSDWTYYSKNLIDIPCLDTVFSGYYTGSQPNCNAPGATSAQMAQTSYAFDEPAYSYTGSLDNATSVSHWVSLQGNNSTITLHTGYSAGSFGMPTSKIDANGNTTFITYDSTGLFPNKIQAPTTYTSGQAISHIEYPSYDDNTGLLTSNTDENSLTTSYYYDSMRRATYILFPDQGWESYQYNDSAPTPFFTYTKGLSPVLSYVAVGTADGLGRIRTTQVTSDPEGTIYKDTRYDNLGRIQYVSNPYRSTADPTFGITSYSYDGLSRKLFECQQDNTTTVVTTCTPNSSYLQWVYSGNVTTSYDELHNAWQRATDGLGRLTAVTEPGNLRTTYAYDALGNLLCADQWGAGAIGSACTSSRKRSFTYDSISRLITSYNPETGTICYGQQSSSSCSNGYDPNGNLLHKTDARGITVNYLYDPLNRLLSKNYTNDTSGTPTSCYQYDLSSLAAPGAYLIGHLVHAWTQTGVCSTSLPTPPFQAGALLTRRSILAYDQMGRILSEQQCTFTNCATSPVYTPIYDYDLAGNIIHHSSGLVNGQGSMTLTNCYDSASRLSLVLNVSANCAAPVYSSSSILFISPTYSPAGGLTAAEFGTGLQMTRSYDTRLRISGETDTGGNSMLSPTSSSATIQILGTEQTH